MIVCGLLLLLVMVGVVLFVGEMLGVIVFVGVVLVSGGILSLVCGCKVDFGLMLVVFIMGVFIVCYMVCDGIGVWVVGNVNVYLVWLFMFDGLLMVLFYCVWKGLLNIDL